MCGGSVAFNSLRSRFCMERVDAMGGGDKEITLNGGCRISVLADMGITSAAKRPGVCAGFRTPVLRYSTPKVSDLFSKDCVPGHYN